MISMHTWVLTTRHEKVLSEDKDTLTLIACCLQTTLHYYARMKVISIMHLIRFLMYARMLG